MHLVTAVFALRTASQASLIGLALALWALFVAPTFAQAQMCPERPPDFRPHVSGGAYAAIVAPGRAIRMSVWLTPVHCSYERGVPRPRAAELRAIVEEGPRQGSEVSLRGAGENLTMRLADPGSYVIAVHSLRSPELAPLLARARVIDPARARETRIRMRFPRDPRVPSRLSIRLRDQDDVLLRATAVRRRDHHEVRVTTEPGTYTLETGVGRQQRVSLGDASELDVVFGGTSVTIATDGLPGDGHTYDLELTYADGRSARRHHHLAELVTHLGDDVPPGPLSVQVRRSSPAGAPVAVRTMTIDVPVASELVVRWSIPALLAGEDPSPRAWTALPGRGRLVPSTPPSEVRFFAMHEGRALVLDEALFEHDSRWSLPDDLVRGPMLSHGGPLVEEHVTARAVLVGASTWASIEGGPYVTLRSARGVAQELLPTYERDAVYPCYTTGITHTTGISAGSSGALVVVGRCRGHAPEHDTQTPHTGFIAERGAERWTIERDFAPLRAVASDGTRIVAVGDRGQIVLRDRGRWVRRTHGDRDFVGVALSGARVVVRTRDGALLELPERDRQTPAIVHARSENGVPHPAADHCFAGDRLVVWHRAAERGQVLPEIVIVHEPGSPSRTVHQSSAASIRALACDGDNAWTLVAEHGALALRRVGVEP